MAELFQIYHYNKSTDRTLHLLLFPNAITITDNIIYLREFRRKHQFVCTFWQKNSIIYNTAK
jgi:hypothetical protein